MPYSDLAEAVDVLTALHLLKASKRPRGKARSADYHESRQWGWRSNIVGIGVARKSVKREESGPLGLTIFVRRKLPRSKLRARRRIPPELHIRAMGKTIVTDIVQLDGMLIGHGPMDRIRPLQPGVAAAHEFGDNGTLCAVVRLAQSPQKLFGLGCSHTFARCGIDVNPGRDLIEQPQAVANLGANAVGTLTANFSTIAFDRSPNRFDFAVFEIDAAAGQSVNTIVGLTRAITTVDGRTPEALSQQVETELFGSRTVGAAGSTLAYNSSFTVGLRRPNGSVGNAVFTKVVAYRTDCSEGDSGGAVLEKGTGNLLGMHFAGIQASRFGLFIPAGPLFSENGLSLA